MPNVLLESPIENATFEIRGWKTNGKTPKAEKLVSLGFLRKTSESHRGGVYGPTDRTNNDRWVCEAGRALHNTEEGVCLHRERHARTFFAPRTPRTRTFRPENLPARAFVRPENAGVRRLAPKSLAAFLTPISVRTVVNPVLCYPGCRWYKWSPDNFHGLYFFLLGGNLAPFRCHSFVSCGTCIPNRVTTQNGW